MEGVRLYPMIETLTEKINEFISDQKPKTTEWIDFHIRNHDTSKMLEGERYYESENDILKKQQYAVVDGQKVVDHDKPNNKIPHGYHKLLVDQKVSYLVGRPINFSCEDETLLEYVNENMGEKWDDIAGELVRGASNKGIEWLHVFIDEEGTFDYIVIPAEQVIPIYKDEKEREIEYIIRYYPFVLDGQETLRVEVWDEEQVTYYMQVDGEYTLDPTEEINPQSHFYWGNDKTSKGYGWGKVPFVHFKNNTREKSDLTYYKQLIDAFDKRVSDNQDNFEEIQELIYVLKGYEGENLSNFMRNLKYYRAIKAAEDGGVDTLQAEIPMESIDSHLDRLNESIFTFGQGIDPTFDEFGNNSSGIALKFLYALLDLKASQTERRFKKSLQILMWFLCEYLSMSGKGEFDYKSINSTFRRNMMVNDKENSEIAKDSMGVISHETIVANHPWVDDSQLEMERIEKEKGDVYDEIPDNVDDDDE